MQNAARQTPTPTWANLPSDILILIMQNLSYIDQIYSRAVCKNWRFDIHGMVQYSDKRSWLFRLKRPYRNNNSVGYYLFDPTYKRKYNIESDIAVGARVHASKYGWLLLSKETKCTIFFYFYCPFTNQIIQLPELKTKKMISWYNVTATFSAAPTSSHCVICVALAKYIRSRQRDEYKFTLCTSSPGDNSWNLASFYTAHDMGFYRAACVEGVFYFICADLVKFKPIEIGVYKPAMQEWKSYESPHLNDSSCFYRCYLIESCDDENLLIAYISMSISTGDPQWHFIRFEPTEMDWREIESLGDRMLFLGVTSTSIRGGKLTNTMREANYNYWRDTDYRLFKFYKEFKSELCPQTYDWIEEKELRNVWIQPPEIGKRNRPNNFSS